MSNKSWVFNRPDWRCSDAYEFVGDLSYAQWAWEFLRRNKRYQHDYVGALDATPITARKAALKELRDDAPLRWFVPKKGAGRFGKFNQTLGEFVINVRAANAGDPARMVSIRREKPEKYSVSRFIDPNESPLKNDSIFIKNYIESRSAKDIEDWDDEERQNFLDLNDYQIAFKVDLRFPAGRTKKLINEVLRDYRKQQKSGDEAIGSKPKKRDRVLLLRVLDSNEDRLNKNSSRLKVKEVLKQLFSSGDEANIDKRYYRLLSRAKAITEHSYRFIARI